MLTLFKSGAYMALKVDIWPPLPLETQNATYMALCLESRTTPPLSWQPETPRVASKDCVVGEKKATYMPPLIKGPASGPLHGPMFAQKHPYMRRCSTPPSTPSKLLHRSHECHEHPPLFWRNLRRKKQNEHLEHPLKAGQYWKTDQTRRSF